MVVGGWGWLGVSLRASSPIWASEASLAKLVLLAQIGELARRLAGGLPYKEANGDVPLDGVAFLRLD